MSGLAQADLLAGFQALDVTCVSDAMDRLGLSGACQGLLPVVPGTRLAGFAFTVRYQPCGATRGTVGDFLDDVGPDEVVAIDNAGRTAGTVWGDIMTVFAGRRGLRGTVIDGVCRDLPRILELRYPIFTRGRSMITGKDRVEVASVNAPVTLADQRVEPRDLLLADDTGVIRVPLARAAEVLDIARSIDEAERLILARIEQGASLREARASVGYHALQTRRPG